MAIDEMKYESGAEEFNRLAEEYHNALIQQNSSGLDPISDKITDICAELICEIQNFVKQHNSLKDIDPDDDNICDAAYNFHKIAFMLHQCVDELHNNIDTSWYHGYDNSVASVEVESNEPQINIDEDE